MTGDRKGRGPRGVSVSLVGAGPGDPGLFTLAGAERIRAADVILYDALANPKLLDLARPDAERILVGKRRGRTSVSQEEIERLLIDRAAQGLYVVRLKGGDPFVFGRGGEEAQACRAAGVSFEVVPGVTSAIAAPAYAGIPLTHRDHCSSVTFVTAQPGEHDAAGVPDWSALGRTRSTLVFLMGMLRGREISEGLIAAGMPATTSVAVVQWGTMPRQSRVSGTLAELEAMIESSGLRPPGVIVVGSVSELAGEIAWYESLPLYGRRVVVTRARHQADALASRLEAFGAEAREFPVIEIVPPQDQAAVSAYYDSAGAYDWLVLTSVNGAGRFFDGYLAAGHDIRELAGVRIAAIGEATAAAIEQRGVRVEVVPTAYRAEALIEALGDVTGLRVLIARAAVAREILPKELSARGARVDVMALYRARRPDPAPDVAELEGADVVTFTSAGTVKNYFEIGGEAAARALQGAVVAAIGPITADALRDRGFEPAVVANPYTIPSLVDALVNYFANRQELP